MHSARPTARPGWRRNDPPGVDRVAGMGRLRAVRVAWQAGHVSRQPLRLAILEATSTLGEAGVPSPRADAEILAAHVVGVERTRLGLVPLVDAEVIDLYLSLVADRAKRVPLQYLTGSAAMGSVSVEVGPGVFIPRPETELLLGWALATLEARHNAEAPQVVMDLCTGSGALALAIAHALPDAVVHAVELDPSALAWARRNADRRAQAGDTPVNLYRGDVTDRDLLGELEGRVDLIVANPPYVPSGAVVEREVAEHDPAMAVFAGEDGLDVIKPMVNNAARWLRIGGAIAVEHDDTNGEQVAELFRTRRVFGDVEQHLDLTGKPRFVVARRVATEAEADRLR